MTAKAVELCKLIHQAFGSMPYPGDDHIVYDNSGYHLECAQTKVALEGKHWRDAPFDTLDHLRSALSFLSPEGFRFYLPAFLTTAVVDYRRAGAITDTIMVSLTPPRLSDVEERGAALERYAKSNPKTRILPLEQVQQINSQMEESYQSGEDQRWFDERVSGFTAEQSKAIRRFLEYMRDVHSNDY